MILMGEGNENSIEQEKTATGHGRCSARQQGASRQGKRHQTVQSAGGGIEGRESTMEAALRELREETRLRPLKAERLFDHEGTTQIHKVVWVQVRGRVTLQRKELADYKWWDGEEPVSMLPSARTILDRCMRGRPGESLRGKQAPR